MKAYWGSAGIAPRILTSAVDGGEWSDSPPDLFTPTEKDPGTHSIGGWVGPIAGLDAVAKEKISNPYRHSNSRLSSPLSNAVPLSYTG
jgi:hypothetical protein